MRLPQVIIGVGGILGHDANAVLLQNGHLIASSQQERFSRKKHDPRFPSAAIIDCLKFAGIRPEEVEICAFAEKPLQSLIFERVGKPTNIFTWLSSCLVGEGGLAYPREARQLLPNARFRYAWHHLSHAAAAFATSPFEEAAFLCVDGKGEDICASVGIANARDTKILYEMPYENGLGLLYTLVAYYLGFDSYGSEYKVMGLAPYGEPTFERRLREFAISDDNGGFRLKRPIKFAWSSMRAGINELEQHLGLPARKKDDPLSDDHVNVAASIQSLFEDEVLKMARFARKVTGQRNLLFCGGCAQNCVTAGKLRRSDIFVRVVNSPVGGDMGSALGAALLVRQKYEKTQDGKIDAKGFYLGSDLGEPPAEAAQYKIPLSDDVHHAAARLLAEGKVLGWVRGRMELGARALGARSILADPRVANMQSVLNLKVKFRESFRPFAPSILAEDCCEWFDAEEPSDFMEYTAYLLPRHRHPVPRGLRGLRERLDFKRCELPSVVHVDYSARLQTVRKSVHPDFHRLISEFKQITGVPLVINTSFNVSGQPIVRSAEDAWLCFCHTDIDYLVINESIYRNPNDKTREEKQRWLKQFENYW